MERELGERDVAVKAAWAAWRDFARAELSQLSSDDDEGKCGEGCMCVNGVCPACDGPAVDARAVQG